MPVTTKTCAKCAVEKPHGEFYVVKGKLYPYCKECKRAMCRVRWHRDKDALSVKRREWATKNPDKVRESSRRARERKPEKSREAGRKWYHANKDQRKLSQQAWNRANRHKMVKSCADYKARKLRAIPSWANLDYIENMYVCAALCSEATGIKYHVDHIVPLYSELVCGLHVSDNLQVIPGAENLSKGNYRWPDMP